ncbi:MAG: LacI family DNA-binding transcriptional regulator [Christensenellales bacterium]|jgi:LacI family transcriptional regulator
MIKIVDIAKDMGLSEATISNALSGRGRMKAQTRAAIISRAQEMGYTPPVRARKKSQNSLIVIAEDLRTSFVCHILEGIREAAQEEGLFLPIYNLGMQGVSADSMPEVKDINQAVEALIGSLAAPVGGAIYVAQYPRLMSGLMAGMSFPVISAFCTRESGVPCVHYDDKQGAYIAVNHLIDSGRNNIAMISGPIDSIGMIYRTSGYQRALVDRGLAFNPLRMRIGDWSMRSGYAVTKSLLNEDGRIDSIFAQNDNMALGALYAIHEKGLRVPEDISIVGFDNSKTASTSIPQLSSVSPPFVQMGQQAFQMAMDMLEKKNVGNIQNVFIPCTLVHRGTTIDVDEKTQD